MQFWRIREWQTTQEGDIDTTAVIALDQDTGQVFRISQVIRS